MVSQAKPKSRVVYRKAKTRHHRKGGMKLPVTLILGFAPLVGNAIGQVQTNGWQTGLKNTVSYVMPFNPNTGKVTFSNLGGGLLPIAVGALTHKLANMFGINAWLSRNNIPLLRL